MQISNQQSQVQHEYEHQRTRMITSVDTDTAPDSREHLSEVAHKPTDDSTEPSISLSLSAELMLKKKLLESITDTPNKRYRDMLSYEDLLPATKQPVSAPTVQQNNVYMLDGYTVTDQSQLSVTERLYEYESLDFSTQLAMTSADGVHRELSFSMSFTRELDITQELTLTAAAFKDPLILNLTNTSQLFSSDSMLFDLEGDGIKDELPSLNAGVWFLAQDTNNNAKIESGAELFGALTGNGFSELANYDSDANGVIDARDNRFDKLQLWDGKQQLESLSTMGVSAILLNASHTPFTFTDTVGNPRAQLRQTSVFIDEQHRLGAIHQIDIAV